MDNKKPSEMTEEEVEAKLEAYLLDAWAGQVMEALVRFLVKQRELTTECKAMIAQHSFDMAEVMIEERRKRYGTGKKRG